METTPTEQSPALDGAAPGPRARPVGSGAVWVSAGIFLSRIFGFVRQAIFAHYLGDSMAAGAYMAAQRIPNFLQNLFGEGVLSGSFIPVYTSLVAKGDRKGADELAGAIFGLLFTATSVLVALGVTFTPELLYLVAPGFSGEARALTILLVRIMFPGIGLLVLSAWCLGVLNSHRRFFLSYASPVLWNCAIIASLVVFRREGMEQLSIWVAWGTTVGCLVQLVVQLPSVLRLLSTFRPGLGLAVSSVRTVLGNFGPIVLARGVVQVSAYVELGYSSLISPEVLSRLAYAQTIYLLPVSLFGMAIAAAELPAMSEVIATSGAQAAALRARVDASATRMAFFVVPSAAAFLLLGDVLAGVLLQRGHFGADASRFVWFLLMGSSFGLLASTLGRLYSSAFYALKDTRTPLYFAIVRVSLTAAASYYCVRYLPGQLGIPRELGAVGITFTTGVAAWLEYLLLRRALRSRVGDAGLPLSRGTVLVVAALLGGAAGLGVKALLVRAWGADPALATTWGGGFLSPPLLHARLFGFDFGTAVIAALVLSAFGGVYLGLTALLGVPESRTLWRRLLRRR